MGLRVRRRFQFRGYRRQQVLRSLASGIVTAAVGLALTFNTIGADFERTVGLNWLFKHRGEREGPPDIAVLGISTDTEKALGLPIEVDECRLKEWPRAVHAVLINRLIEKKAEGIVYDVYFENAKGDEDATLKRAIAQADRVVLYEWMNKSKEAGVEIEKILPPTKDLAERAKAFGPFVLPKTDPKFFRFWAFKPTIADPNGDATPTLPAIALQLKALPVYTEWLAVLKAAGAGTAVEALSAPENVRHLMQNLRQMFREDPSLKAKVEKRARNDERLDTETRNLLRALAALYGGPNDYYLNFYGGPGTIRTIPYESLLTYEVQYRNETSAPFRQDETLTFANPEGTARLSDMVSLGTGRHFLKFKLLGGSPPVGNSRIIGGTSGANAVAVTEAVPIDKESLTNTMVFVGCSDAKHVEGPDRFLTSFTTEDGVDLRGVEIMATAYANLLTQRTLPPPDTLSSKLSVLAFGLVVGILVYLFPAVIAVPGAFALAFLYYAILQWRFNEADLWLPLAIPVVQFVLAVLIGWPGQSLLERRKKEHLIEAIGYYLPDNLVRDLTERRVNPTTLNRVVFGTCLATDMSDFIALGESKPPQELADFMNEEYYDPLAQTLKRHGADVMEFRADMIMCAWIAPGRAPAACRKAMEAAIEVSEIITRFAQQHGSRHFNPRIGLHDGNIYVGHTGGGGHYLYSIVGDAANTAARLESLNKHLGTHILAAESVVQDSNGLLLRNLGLFRLRGKAEPTSIFEILGRKESARAEHLELCAQFAEGLAVFQRKEWSRAAEAFEALTKNFAADGPSRFFWAQCKKYAANTVVCDGTGLIQMDDK
jgi:adenylate cyclase